jgi:hypothetical protein
MASAVRKQSRLGLDASANFRQQSALCLAVARKREQPAQQLGLLQLADHWQRAADASDLCLRDAADDDERSFTVSLT